MQLKVKKELCDSTSLLSFTSNLCHENLVPEKKTVFMQPLLSLKWNKRKSKIKQIIKCLKANVFLSPQSVAMKLLIFPNIPVWSCSEHTQHHPQNYSHYETQTCFLRLLKCAKCCSGIQQAAEIPLGSNWKQHNKISETILWNMRRLRVSGWLCGDCIAGGRLLKTYVACGVSPVQTRWS